MINDYSEVTVQIPHLQKKLHDFLLKNKEKEAWVVAGEMIGLLGELQYYLIKKEHG